MRRWLVLTLGLGLAGLVGYSLLTAGPGRSPHSGERDVSARRDPAQAPSEAEPRGHIGEASREALREILRGADGEESR